MNFQNKNKWSTRWLFSTNHKDIGTLYLIFSISSFFLGSFFITYLIISNCYLNLIFQEIISFILIVFKFIYFVFVTIYAYLYIRQIIFFFKLQGPYFTFFSQNKKNLYPRIFSVANKNPILLIVIVMFILGISIILEPNTIAYCAGNNQSTNNAIQEGAHFVVGPNTMPDIHVAYTCPPQIVSTLNSILSPPVNIENYYSIFTNVEPNRDFFGFFKHLTQACRNTCLIDSFSFMEARGLYSLMNFSNHQESIINFRHLLIERGHSSQSLVVGRAYFFAQNMDLITRVFDQHLTSIYNNLLISTDRQNDASNLRLFQVLGSLVETLDYLLLIDQNNMVHLLPSENPGQGEMAFYNTENNFNDHLENRMDEINSTRNQIRAQMEQINNRNTTLARYRPN